MRECWWDVRMTESFNKVNVSEDDIFKKEIGKSIKKYREEILQITRERFGDKIGCKFYTLENVERGVSYPDINFISGLSNHCGRPIYSFIMSDYEIRVSYADRKLLGSYPAETQLDILMHTECEKNDILYMYDKKMIRGIFNNEKRLRNETIGYLVRFEREKRKMSRGELAGKIGFEEKSINNFEFGNSRISFRALNKICNVMQVPMDYFLAGYLDNKNVVIDYLLMDLFKNTNEKERYFLEEFIRLLKYRIEMNHYTDNNF